MAITIAFVVSIINLDTCDLVEGEALHYRIPDEDLDPLGQEPELTNRPWFILGVYKANAPLSSYYYGDQYIDYGNGISDIYLNAGAAEGSARFLNTFAAAIGGLSMLVFFGLAATEQKTSVYMMLQLFSES